MVEKTLKDMEDILENCLVDPSVLHEDLLRHQVLGQTAVELLVHLLDVPPRGEYGEEHVRGADEGEEHQKKDGEPAVQSPAHEAQLPTAPWGSRNR